MEIVWVDEATHSLAMTALLAAQRRKLSLVDCVSFAVIRAKGSQVAFAFAFDRQTQFGPRGLIFAVCLLQSG
jgi:predicted nucleic acid-binding protein